MKKLLLSLSILTLFVSCSFNPNNPGDNPGFNLYMDSIWDGGLAPSTANKCGYFLDMDFGKYSKDAGYIVVKKL